MKLKAIWTAVALSALAVVSAGAATYDNEGFKAVQLLNIDRFEIYAAPSFEVTDEGGPVAVKQTGSWLSVTAPRDAAASVRIGMPEVHELRVTGSAGTVSQFSTGHDLLITARDAALQLNAAFGRVSIYAADGSSVELSGSADSLLAKVRGTSEIAVTDFDAVHAEVDLREESVGSIDGLTAELVYRVYDVSELYYAPGTRLGQQYHVGDDAIFATR